MPTPLVFDVQSKRITTESDMLATAVTSDVQTDTTYVVVGTSVLPVRRGAVRTGVWRSKRLVLSSYTGFGWVRVTAQSFVSGVVVRLYADGALFYETPAIMSREPVRLPPGKARRWEVEIESADRIVSIVIATTMGEIHGA